jgi:hypothetical protein
VITPEYARQLFPFLVAISVGAGAYVLWRMLYAIKTFIDNAVDSASGKTAEQLAARAWYQKPCASLLLVWGAVAILAPLCIALMKANSRMEHEADIHRAAVSMGYEVLCQSTTASYETNKDWCDHPHWISR